MKLKNTSASQVTAWGNCPRYWHFAWVKGLKAPPSLAMQRGSFIHAAAEHLLKTGSFLENEWKPYAQAMKPYLPLDEKKILVEHRMEIDTAPGLPYWLGFIDLLDDSRTQSKLLRITDHKTTSDFRYTKTPEELRTDNPQLNSYAQFVFLNGHDEDLVEVGHLYIKTAKKTPKRALPKIKPVYTELTRRQTQANWEKDLVKVEDMVRAAEIENTDLLEPLGTKTGHCKKYGGCPYRSRCGLAAETSNPFKNIKNANKGKIVMGFLDDLEAAKDADEKSEASAPSVPEGVLSADAASRESDVKEPEEKETAPEPKPKKKTRKATTKKKKSFSLYIGCLPYKRAADEVELTLFEDWVSNIREQLNQKVMEEKNLPDYRLLPFAEEKALMAAAVNASIDKGLPPAMLVSGSHVGSAEIIEILTPHATTVVRALR